MRRRRAYPAALAVVLLVGGQLAALAHYAATRHVTCAEHGELLEAATLVDRLHACEHDHLIGVEGQLGSEHDDCTIARACHQSATPAQPLCAPTLVPALATAEVAAVVPLAVTDELYLIAPKTSPPAAL